MRPKLAFVDTETTGLDADKHRVIELALMVVDEGPEGWEKADVKTYRFRPSTEDLRAAQPEALKVNGYHSEHADWASAPELEGPEARLLWQEIADQLDGAMLVGHNVLFDRGFLWQELCRHRSTTKDGKHFNLLQRESNDGPWVRRHLDTYAFGYLAMLEFDLKSMSLKEVTDRLGLTVVPAHRAAGDVLRTFKLYSYGVSRTRDRGFEESDGVASIAAMRRLLSVSRPPAPRSPG